MVMKIECLFKDRGILTFDTDRVAFTYDGNVSFIKRNGFKIKVSYKKKYPDDFVVRINSQIMLKGDLANKLKEFGVTEDFWVAFIDFEN